MGIQSAPTREAAEQIMRGHGFVPAPVIPKRGGYKPGPLMSYWWHPEHRQAGSIYSYENGTGWICGWWLSSFHVSKAFARAIAAEPVETAAWRIAKNLAALQKRWLAEGPNHEEFAEHARLVIRALEGKGDVFMMLDERPSYFDGYEGRGNAYHCLLRNVRNSPIYGRQLIASFRRD